MNAAELRLLSEALSWHVGQTFTPGHQETFAQAAELIELLAWADGEQVEIHKTMSGVHVVIGWGPLEFHGDTLLDTLQRAREASNGRA